MAAHVTGKPLACFLTFAAGHMFPRHEVLDTYVASAWSVSNSDEPAERMHDTTAQHKAHG